jgi:hypothetical protein
MQTGGYPGWKKGSYFLFFFKIPASNDDTAYAWNMKIAYGR